MFCRVPGVPDPGDPGGVPDPGQVPGDPGVPDPGQAPGVPDPGVPEDLLNFTSV